MINTINVLNASLIPVSGTYPYDEHIKIINSYIKWSDGYKGISHPAFKNNIDFSINNNTTFYLPSSQKLFDIIKETQLNTVYQGTYISLGIDTGDQNYFDQRYQYVVIKDNSLYLNPLSADSGFFRFNINDNGSFSLYQGAGTLVTVDKTTPYNLTLQTPLPQNEKHRQEFYWHEYQNKIYFTAHIKNPTEFGPLYEDRFWSYSKVGPQKGKMRANGMLGFNDYKTADELYLNRYLFDVSVFQLYYNPSGLITDHNWVRYYNELLDKKDNKNTEIFTDKSVSGVAVSHLFDLPYNTKIDIESKSMTLNLANMKNVMTGEYGYRTKKIPGSTYSITPNITSVNEGANVIYTIITTNVPNGTVLFWTNNGTTNANDFIGNQNSGSVIINNNTATFTRTLVNDSTTEGAENIIIQLRTRSITGTIVATAATVTVNDTSQAPTYSITPNITSVNEGGSVTFTINTTNVNNGTTLYWTNEGTTNASDFIGNQNSGSVIITNNTATFTRTLVNDLTTEGTENIIMNLRTGSIIGAIVATSSTVQVIDTSKEITYSIIEEEEFANVGETVQWDIYTTNVPNNTVLYWTNIGTSNASDFTDNQNSGSVTINNNTGIIYRTIAPYDNLSGETEETIIMQLRTTSTSGPVVATANPTTILIPERTYSITPNKNSVNENGSVTYTINTTNVNNGTTLYWTNEGTTNASDFTDNQNSGSVTINNNTATFTRTLVNDSTTEGTENIIMKLRTGPITGTIVATAATVTVNDTSQAPTYSITPNTTNVNEGGSVIFNINTTDVPTGTVLFWTNIGTSDANDFSGNQNSGQVTINNNTATFTITLVNDLTTEGVETITIQLRTGSITGTIVATATTVLIIDTSITIGTGDPKNQKDESSLSMQVKSINYEPIVDINVNQKDESSLSMQVKSINYEPIVDINVNQKDESSLSMQVKSINYDSIANIDVQI